MREGHGEMAVSWWNLCPHEKSNAARIKNSDKCPGMRNFIYCVRTEGLKTSGWNPHKSLAPVASASLPLNRLHVRLLLCSLPSLREILNHPCLPSHLLLSVKYPPKITSPGPQINCHLQTLKVCAWFGCVIYDSLCVSSWCKPGRHSVQKQNQLSHRNFLRLSAQLTLPELIPPFRTSWGWHCSARSTCRVYYD